jgi:ABC-type lipoprotein release transport system permease subunit
VASILFSVFFAVFMRSMQLGSYDKMIESMVRFYSGHVQVHAKGYWDDQILDNSFDLNDPELKAIADNLNVEMASNRLEGFALSSMGELTKGVLMIGMDPEVENRLMDLEPKIQSGVLFDADDRSVMVAEKVAEYYKLAVGDTMVFISQGYHGVSAAAKYPVSSIVRFTSIVLNERAVMFPMKEAQNFFGTEGRATSVAVILANPNKMDKVVNELTASLDTSKYEVLDWEEAMPELVQAIEADGAGGIIMLMILYMVVSFGMFGTVLMLIQERVYEFGVLLSIGMSRLKLWIVVFLESIFTTLIGVVLGVFGVYPFVFYFNRNPYELTGPSADAMTDMGWEPVLPASLDPSIATTHMLIVMAVSIVIAFYPAFIIRKLNPVEARRN